MTYKNEWKNELEKEIKSINKLIESLESMVPQYKSEDYRKGYKEAINLIKIWNQTSIDLLKD